MPTTQSKLPDHANALVVALMIMWGASVVVDAIDRNTDACAETPTERTD